MGKGSGLLGNPASGQLRTDLTTPIGCQDLLASTTIRFPNYNRK
jgi:hypothetical protein